MKLENEFWVCPDCKQEVAAPKKYLNQGEVDELLEEFERMLRS